MKPTMSTAVAAVPTIITRAGRERPANKALARVQAATTALAGDWVCGSDTGPPELLEGVQDLVSHCARELDRDVSFLDGDHRTVEIVNRPRSQRLRFLFRDRVDRVHLPNRVAQEALERDAAGRFRRLRAFS